ncbi:hypothetical protein [Luteococcus japonicus]|uniref:hypothetical protein n=1 Tax=Luteococcus japonicus TaxID=33984 RepID=UPI000B9C6A86|nr:hypothetical protein [Luteococcus japonicus]
MPDTSRAGREPDAGDVRPIQCDGPMTAAHDDSQELPMDSVEQPQTPADQAAWVHDVLRRAPGQMLPEAVRQRVLDALQVEQDLRENSDFNPDADVEDLVVLDAKDQAFRAFSRMPKRATDWS